VDVTEGDDKIAPQAFIGVEFREVIIGLARHHRQSADRATLWLGRLAVRIHGAGWQSYGTLDMIKINSLAHLRRRSNG